MSFEQFKKSRHSQKSQDSQVSFRSFENQPISLSNVSFSINEIVFRLTQKQQILVNEQLKVINRTGTRLYYQIKSNNPQYYEIRPNQDIIEINAVANISFKLIKSKVVMNLNNPKILSTATLSSYVNNHAFQFSWGQITQENITKNQIPFTPNRQVFKVRIQGPKNVGQSQLGKFQIHNNSNSKFKSPYKDMSSLKDMSMTNKTLSEENLEYSSLLTLPIISIVAFVSFIIGYISA